MSVCTLIALSVRQIVALYGLVCLVIGLIMAVVWYHKNRWSKAAWLNGMGTFHIDSLGRPEVWAAAVVQALFSLGLGTNQVPTVAGKAPTEKVGGVRVKLYVLHGFLPRVNCS